jgi:hypothetical protein
MVVSMNDIQVKNWQKLSHMQRRVTMAWWFFGIKSYSMDTGIVYRDRLELYRIAAIKEPKNHGSAKNSSATLWSRNDRQLEQFIFGPDGIHWNNDQLKVYEREWGLMYPFEDRCYPFASIKGTQSRWLYQLKRRQPFDNCGKLDTRQFTAEELAEAERELAEIEAEMNDV